MNLEPLDFSKPEYGPEYLRAQMVESFADCMARRRDLGLPLEPEPGKLFGMPIVYVDDLTPPEMRTE
jgi:hypothetical protein